MTTRDVLSEACQTVTAVVAGSTELDPGAPTPCRDYDVLTLARHFVGTSGAFVRAGRDHALDPDDPWGARTAVGPADWRARLTTNLTELADAWAGAAAWQGSVPTGASEMPAQALGELALVEIMLHGWDLGAASGQSVVASPALAAELLRCVADTAELGRRSEVYGPLVPVPEDAPDLDRALGLAGRQPRWRAPGPERPTD